MSKQSPEKRDLEARQQERGVLPLACARLLLESPEFLAGEGSVAQESNPDAPLPEKIQKQCIACLSTLTSFGGTEPNDRVVRLSAKDRRSDCAGSVETSADLAEVRARIKG